MYDIVLYVIVYVILSPHHLCVLRAPRSEGCGLRALGGRRPVKPPVALGTGRLAASVARQLVYSYYTLLYYAMLYYAILYYTKLKL